jgi:very-short-patch-repair endonuclease
MAGVARRFRLPPYEYQYDVFGDGSVLLDFAWVAERVGAEVDGLETHGTAVAMQRDFERDQLLEIDHGWYILHFTWFDVVKRPKHVVDQILKVLDARRTALRS